MKILHVDPVINSKDFYLSVDHRKANLYFSRLKPNTQIYITKVTPLEDEDLISGHINTWKNIIATQDNIISSDGIYRFTDSCVTNRCKGKIQIEFTYNDKSYVFILAINTIS